VQQTLTKNKKCKNCGTKFDQYGFGDVACSGKCKVEWSNKLKGKNEALKEKYSTTILDGKHEVDNNLLRRPLPQLLDAAVQTCHKYIRLRDAGQPCISCDEFRTLQAGHFYSANEHPCLKFSDLNINGQCEECNGGKYGNFDEYEKRLREKIGPFLLTKLEETTIRYKRLGWKWDRPALITIINEYKEKIKLL